MSERQSKAGNQEHSFTLSFTFFDMQNNFCFHIQLVGSICTKSCVHHEKVAVPHFSRVLYILRKWPGNGILGALDQ